MTKNDLEKFKKSAFTLAEIMIVISIVAIISIFWVKIAKSKIDYATKLEYFATVKNLKLGGANLIAKGYTDSNGDLQKTLPADAHNTDNTGFCDRLSDLYNTQGTVDCTQTAAGLTDFSGATPNFTLSNSSVFYNLGSALQGSTDCPSNYYSKQYDSSNYMCTQKSDLAFSPYGSNYWQGAENGCEAIGENWHLATNSQYSFIKNSGYIPLPEVSASYWTYGVSCAEGEAGQSTVMHNGTIPASDCTTYTDNSLYARCVKMYFPSSNGYYDFYVDINGRQKGESLINNDVFEFYITRTGIIYPALSSNPQVKAAIYYKANSTDRYATILIQNLGYREALCRSNTVEKQMIDNLNYCSGYTIDKASCPDTSNTCKVVLIKPGY